MNRAILRSSVVAIILGASACGGSAAVDSSAPVETTAAPDVTTTEDSEAPTTEPAPTTTEVAGELVSLVGGGQLDLNSIEGQDTVLWFWAPW